jgi:hypothetical protein
MLPKTPALAVLIAAIVGLAGTARAQDDGQVETEGPGPTAPPDSLDQLRGEAHGDVTPQARVQLALAEAAFRRWLDAEAHLQAALESRSDPWILENRPQLLAALTGIRGHIAEVNVTGTPGAHVYVNFKPTFLRLPLKRPLRLPEGQVMVQIAGDLGLGLAPVAKPLTLVGGTVQTIDGHLDPLPASHRNSREQMAAREREQSDELRLNKTLAWGLGVAAAPTLAVGAYLLAVAGDCATQPPPGFQCNTLRGTRGAGLAVVGLGVALATTAGIFAYKTHTTEVVVALGPNSLIASGRF